ncbi:hypothetical protein ABFX02_11G109000 [Erythranthe guttata]
MDNNPILQSSNKHARRQIYAFRPSGVENSPEYLLSFPGGGYIRVPTGCVLFHNGCVLPENFNIRRTKMNFYPPIVPPLPDLPQGHVYAAFASQPVPPEELVFGLGPPLSASFAPPVTVLAIHDFSSAAPERTYCLYTSPNTIQHLQPLPCSRSGYLLVPAGHVLSSPDFHVNQAPSDGQAINSDAVVANFLGGPPNI